MKRPAEAGLDLWRRECSQHSGRDVFERLITLMKGTLLMPDNPPAVNTATAKSVHRALTVHDYSRAAKIILAHPQLHDLAHTGAAVHFCDIALDGHGAGVSYNLRLIACELYKLERGVMGASVVGRTA